ncbi:hypothetical protein Lbir_2223, partial [Legionella birminghamensis]
MPKKKTAPPSRWDRVFIDRAVLEGYRRGPEPVYKLADAMLSGESVSYEEFSDKDNLGSARLSGADRALIVNFGRTAMIAGIAEHHAYAQSPLYHLRDGVAKYRAKYGAS